MKAEITDLCTVAIYRCANDGSGIVVTIVIGYQSVTGEWLDCTTFNLPMGWTYLPGSEIGTFTNADGNYISDTGNSVTFGTAGFCPGGDSDLSIFGEGPNSFSFTIVPPAGWNAGDCDPFTPDGDPIVGITWDYFGDGYGEASASSPGNNGEATEPFDATDSPEFSVCETTGIIPIAESEITVCPQEQVSLGLDPSLQLGCVENYLVQFDDSMGGTGGIAGGFNVAFDAASNTFDAGVLGVIETNGLDSLGGTWCVTAFIVSGQNVCTISETLCITYLDTNDPTCQNISTCTANFGSFTDECDFIVPGPDCMLDQLITPGNTAGYEIFYETDGSSSIDGIINASGAYTTGQDILNNASSGLPGEVIFFGMPGDCDGIPKPSSVFCTPFTLDVYIVPVEYITDASVTLNATCPIETITIVLNPTQDNLTYVETPGNCDTPATVTVGFDFGDGAGNAPDGDLDDPEDAICGIIESPIPASPPCDGADNIETTPPLTATELAGLLGFAAPECYTDVTATAEALCSSVPCSNCNDPCANNTGDPLPCTYDPEYDVCDDACEFTTDTYNNTTCECDFILITPDCDDNNPSTDDGYNEANCACINTPNTDMEVPTVGEWGLIILGLLMLITAVAGIRQRGIMSKQILH